MASICIVIWVDSDGNVKLEADDYEAFNNLDDGLAVRKVVLTVEVPEPQEAEEIEIQVPEETPAGEPTVKVGAVPALEWQPETAVLEPVKEAPEPAARRWFGR